MYTAIDHTASACSTSIIVVEMIHQICYNAELIILKLGSSPISLCRSSQLEYSEYENAPSRIQVLDQNRYLVHCTVLTINLYVNN